MNKSECAWCIYYTDETTFSSKDGSPFDAPQIDVQALAESTPGGKRPFRVNIRQDHFCWSNLNGWYGCDWSGLWDYLMHYKGPKAVLFGRMATDKQFQRITKKAFDEGVG